MSCSGRARTARTARARGRGTGRALQVLEILRDARADGRAARVDHLLATNGRPRRSERCRSRRLVGPSGGSNNDPGSRRATVRPRALCSTPPSPTRRPRRCSDPREQPASTIAEGSWRQRPPGRGRRPLMVLGRPWYRTRTGIPGSRWWWRLRGWSGRRRMRPRSPVKSAALLARSRSTGGVQRGVAARLAGDPGRVEVEGPLPHQAVQFLDAPCVGPAASHRREHGRRGPRVDVAQAREERRVARGVAVGLVGGRGQLPLCDGREPLPARRAVGARGEPRHLDHGAVGRGRGPRVEVAGPVPQVGAIGEQARHPRAQPFGPAQNSALAEGDQAAVGGTAPPQPGRRGAAARPARSGHGLAVSGRCSPPAIDRLPGRNPASRRPQTGARPRHQGEATHATPPDPTPHADDRLTSPRPSSRPAPPPPRTASPRAPRSPTNCRRR